MKNLTTRKLVIVAMLGAITVVLGLTPLGFIPIGPLNATTMHIPVILAAILEGPIVGALVGLIFGLSSLFNAITRPTPISIVFYNPLISILPRILIGLIAYYIYRAVRDIDGGILRKIALAAWVLIFAFLAYGIVRAIPQGFSISMGVNIALAILVAILFVLLLRYKTENVSVMVSAFLTTICHSIMVMGGIYFLYAEEFIRGVGADIAMARSVIFSVIITSGVPEGIIAVIICTAVVSAVLKSNN
ncbi:MAG: ECF transporter S component [Tissierellia bacterium]|nr:ECF transporter S component [Tissierellia bacterium]